MSRARKARRGAPRLELAGRMTQAECALALGVSRARISQIEARALGKLRAGLWDWRATP